MKGSAAIKKVGSLSREKFAEVINDALHHSMNQVCSD